MSYRLNAFYVHTSLKENMNSLDCHLLLHQSEWFQQVRARTSDVRWDPLARLHGHRARSQAPASFSREGALSVASERGPAESVMLHATFNRSTDRRPRAIMTGGCAQRARMNKCERLFVFGVKGKTMRTDARDCGITGDTCWTPNVHRVVIAFVFVYLCVQTRTACVTCVRHTRLLRGCSCHRSLRVFFSSVFYSDMFRWASLGLDIHQAFCMRCECRCRIFTQCQGHRLSDPVHTSHRSTDPSLLVSFQVFSWVNGQWLASLWCVWWSDPCCLASGAVMLRVCATWRPAPHHSSLKMHFCAHLHKMIKWLTSFEMARVRFLKTCLLRREMGCRLIKSNGCVFALF